MGRVGGMGGGVRQHLLCLRPLLADPLASPHTAPLPWAATHQGHCTPMHWGNAPTTTPMCGWACHVLVGMFGGGAACVGGAHRREKRGCGQGDRSG